MAQVLKALNFLFKNNHQKFISTLLATNFSEHLLGPAKDSSDSQLDLTQITTTSDLANYAVLSALLVYDRSMLLEVSKNPLFNQLVQCLPYSNQVSSILNGNLKELPMLVQKIKAELKYDLFFGEFSKFYFECDSFNKSPKSKISNVFD